MTISPNHGPCVSHRKVAAAAAHVQFAAERLHAHTISQGLAAACY